MERLRIGILGTGTIVREFHLPVLLENPRVEVVAVGNLHRSSLETLAGRFGISRIYTDFRQMARDPGIDAVVNALPNYLHAPVTIEMLQGGKSVLCEKPMAISVAEAQAMTDAAKTHNRMLMMAYPWRFDIEIRWLREMISSGRLGKVFKVRAHSVLAGAGPQPDSWFTRPELSGGGALTDIGIHAINTISFLFDDRLCALRVFCKTSNNFQMTRVEDTATTIVEYDGGLVAIIEAGWHHLFANSPHGALEVFGTQGYARVFPTEMYCRNGNTEGHYTPKLPIKHSHIDSAMYASQINHFLDCISRGVEPVSSDAQGLKDMVLLEAARHSARCAKSVSIGEQ